MDTSLRWRARAGPEGVHLRKSSVYIVKNTGNYLHYSSNLTLFKMDTSLKRTTRAGPKGVHLRKSSLYYITVKYPVIDHLHYDVIRAKPDGSCCRPAETGASV